ncbi:two-component system response regulator [Methylolobus aquaticus]|nr:two-component system response regulator [Methylolobus aquaticus]
MNSCDLDGGNLSRTLLLVDDVPENLQVLGALLSDAGYRVKVANCGQAALHYARREPIPDLVLLDVMMPDVDGYEVFERLRADPVTRNIPVIFLTGLDEAAQVAHGLGLGAADYITKPIQPAVVLARVRAQIDAKRARDWLCDQNSFLETEVSRRMAENDLIQHLTIRALAHLAEMRDPETGNHILRTEAYVRLLANGLQDHPRFRDSLDAHAIRLVILSAPLHDIGKVGIPDHILRKPGALTAAEWSVMRTHAELGAAAIERAERDIDEPPEFLSVAKDIARSHHERWDGAGYPDGLAGERIPVCARLMALADVFDALVSPRVYKRAFPLDQARVMIAAQRGRHFDPDVTDAFIEGFDAFAEIVQRHTGTD